MPQKSLGLYRILENSVFYNSFLYLIGGNNVKKYFCEQVVKPFVEARVLDVGCGTASVLDFLPKNTIYYGIDYNSHYIDFAQKKYRERPNTTFFHKDIMELSKFTQNKKFDIVLLMGVLHHLSDEDSKALLQKCRKVLVEEGFIASHDPVFIPNQSFLSKLFVSIDRGYNVRDEKGYRDLFGNSFRVKTIIKKYLLNIPHDNCLITAKKK